MDVDAGASLSRLESSVGLGAEEEEEQGQGDDRGPVFDAHNKRRPGIEAGEEDEEEDDDPIVAALPSRRAGGAGGAGASGGGDGMSALLAQYYGLAMDDSDNAGASNNRGGGLAKEGDIDAAEFAVAGYVRRLLQEEGLEGLLARDDELVQEVKRLDSDMQMLVYENYSKFISATDTIRRMKGNVADMKGEMEALAKNMEGIAGRMHVVNDFLAGKRAKVEKLVSARRLLQRLDFLFALPTTLARCVQKGDLAGAVACYAKASPILQRHAHVPSFRAIQRESEQTVAGVMDDLQKRLADAASPPRQLAEYARLLLALGIPRAGLQAQVLAAYKARFAHALSTLATEEENKAKATAAAITSSSTDQLQGQGFGAYVSGAVLRMDTAFVEEVEEGVQEYMAAFGGGGGAEKDSTAAYTELAAVVRAWVKQFLDGLRRLLRLNLTVIAQGMRAGKCHQGQHFPLSMLRQLLSPEGGLFRVHTLVKEAGALEQGRQLLREVANALLFLEFRGLQAWALQRLHSALKQTQATLPKASSSSRDPQAAPSSPSPRMLLDTLLSDTAHEISTTLETLQPAAKATTEALSLSSSSSLHATGTGVHGSSVHVKGTDVMNVGQAVWQFVAWLADAGERLAGVAFRLTENDVVANEQLSSSSSSSSTTTSTSNAARRLIFPERFFAHATSASPLLDPDAVGSLWGAGVSPSSQQGEGGAGVPLQFVLLLAVLCRDLWGQLAPTAQAALERLYPSSSSNPSSNTGATSRLTPEDVEACLKGSGSRLLQHFVEAQANVLAGMMKTQGLDTASAAAVTGEEKEAGQMQVSQATWAKPFVLRLEALVGELGQALSVPVAGVGLSAGRRGERADVSSFARHHHQLGGSGAASLPGLGLLSGVVRGGRGVDVERLFRVKVRVFTPVDLAVEPILLAVLRVACKALIERARAATLSLRGYAQLQVDVQLLRQAVGAYVKDPAVLEALLEEALISAGERTVQPLQQQGANHAVDATHLSAVANAEYSRLCAAVIMAAGGGAPAGGVGGIKPPGGGGYRR